MSSFPRFPRWLRCNSQLQPYRCLLLSALLLGGHGWLWLHPAIGQVVPELSPAPGTIIENQATGSYLDDSDLTDKAIESDLVTLTVAEVAGITVVGTGVSEAPSGVANAGNLQGNGTINTGDIAYFDYTITNVGNDPTQFFIPDAPSSVTGGTFDNTTNLKNPIQIISYQPPGASSIDVSGVTVPTGGARTGPSTATGTDGLLGKNGIILVGGSVTIRVPIKVNVADGQPVTVVMGNTAPNDNSATTQNQVYTNNNNQDIYTQDNPDGTTNAAGTVIETKDPPLNGDTTNRRQEASASQSTTVIGLDFGDAPDTGVGTSLGNYRTTASDGGPSHVIVPGLSLGTKVDADSGTLQNVNADADDTSVTSVNDEDGVTSFPILKGTAGKTYTVSVNVNNTTGQDAYLVGYIDFNQNGDFNDANEQSATIIVTASGTYNVTFTTPVGMTSGKIYARFRLANAQTEVESAVGVAASGEVEDYKLSIVNSPNVLLVKRITAINGGTTTVGGDSLSNYINDPTNAYDDNEITIPTQANPTDPTKDTSNWPNTIGTTSSTFLIGGMDGGKVKSNDELEYTIYFLSSGDTTANNVLFCDRAPENVTFIPTAFNTSLSNDISGIRGADRGIAVNWRGTLRSYTNIQDGDFAYYYPPGSEPNVDFPNKINCGGPNINGAIVVNLGNLPNATAPEGFSDSYGFVRYQVRVK
jgi:uncharacterized repeat protein (TIGR01451 family)